MSHSQRVICATCGRDNPGHLVFCQECGQRLAPRAAAPTPPSGLPPLMSRPPQPAANPLGATVLGDSPPSSAPSSGNSPVARPQPPPFDLAAKPLPSSPSPPGPVRTACARCAAWNEPGVRFCVACGNGLGPMTVPIPAPQPVPAGPISPARVVPLTPFAATPAAEVRVCSRCRGACDPSSQFCRFCGAPLGPSESSASGRPPRERRFAYDRSGPRPQRRPAARWSCQPRCRALRPPHAMERALVERVVPARAGRRHRQGRRRRSKLRRGGGARLRPNRGRRHSRRGSLSIAASRPTRAPRGAPLPARPRLDERVVPSPPPFLLAGSPGGNRCPTSAPNE